MKKTLLGLIVVVALAAIAYVQRSEAPPPPGRPYEERSSPSPRGTPPSEPPSRSSVDDAFRNRSDGVDVQGRGTVAKILADDNDGSRHQRFLVRLESGRTLLISHNIDLAPRVSSLRAGDPIAFRGEYVWNAKGGLIHWTHHDPAGRHVPGWLKHDGRIYQ